MGRRLFVAISAAATFALVGCGINSPDRDVASLGEHATQSAATNDELSGDDYAAALGRYRDCMTEHGVDVATGSEVSDPTQSRQEDDADTSIDLDSDVVAEAQRECEHLRPDGGQHSQLSPDDLDMQREWIQCLRDADLEVIDNGDGMPSVGIPEGDEQAAQAMQECDDAVYGAGQTVEGSTP